MHRCFWTRTVPRSFCKVGAYGTHRHLRRQTAHAAGDLGAAYPIGGGRRDHRDHTGDNADLHGLSPCGCKGTVCIPRLRRYPPARRWRKRLYGAGCRYILHRSFHTSEIWNDLCHADADDIGIDFRYISANQQTCCRLSHYFVGNFRLIKRLRLFL